MREVDGEASDFEVSGKSGSSRSSKHSALRLTCDRARDEIREISQSREAVVAYPLRALNGNNGADFYHHKLYPSELQHNNTNTLSGKFKPRALLVVV